MTNPPEAAPRSAQEFWRKWRSENAAFSSIIEGRTAIAFAEAFAAERLRVAEGWKEAHAQREKEAQETAGLVRDLTESLLAAEERERQLRTKLFHYAPFDGTSHTTACTIWREDGQGHAEGFEGDRGPCNCGALENFYRKRAESAEASLAELRRELEDFEGKKK
jgi:hypothetical protein